MNIGKLGEGVYLLTIGPSGRTIKPAKMAKAVRKPQKQENVSEFPVKDWWTAAEVAIELGIARQKIYGNNSALSQYISRPDGKHFLYHRDLFEDKQAVAMLKGMPQLPAVRQQDSAKTQNVEPVVCEEKKPVEAVAATEATNQAEPAETHAEAQTIVVNRKVYCKELDRTFDSVTDGAKAIGVRREILSKSLRAGHKCHGFTFEYVDEENGLPMWNTVSDIARAIGLSREAVSKYAHSLPTGMVITKRDGTRLFHRDVVSDPIWVKVRENKKMTLPKAVFCEELGKTFPSLVLAANAIGVTKSAITTAIKRNGRCKGYHFSYV